MNEPFFEETLPGCLVRPCLERLLLAALPSQRACRPPPSCLPAPLPTPRAAPLRPAAQVRVPDASQPMGPDASERRYLLCQVVAVESRPPGVYK